MGWVLAVFIVAMVVGPIMYLRPTNKEKRISDLRLAARQAGLNVKLAKLPVLDPELSERVSAGGQVRQPERPCVAYQLCVNADEHVALDVLLLKLPPQPTVPVNILFDGWALAADSKLLPEETLLAMLSELLATAPAYCIGFGIEPRFLSFYWLEAGRADGPEVAEISGFLAEAEREILRCLASSENT